MGEATPSLLKRFDSITGANFDDLFGAEEQAALAQLMDTDRPAYEKLLTGWRTNIEKTRVTKLDRAVAKTLKKVEDAYEAKKREERKAAKGADGQFVYNEQGKIEASAPNIRIALDRIGIVVTFNEFSGLTYVEGWKYMAPEPMSDYVLDDLWVAVDDEFGFRPTKEQFATVIGQMGRVNTFHPVRDYLNSLKWDGKPRLATWLTDYMGVEDTELNRVFARLFLKAAVTRIFRPGYKFDQMLMLKGEQGIMKSTAIQALAGGPEWFSDSMPLNATDQKTIEATRGKWLMEISDLKGNSKAEVEDTKAMLSTQVDRARMAYARMAIEVKRQFVILGTSNVDNPLSDLTGNRRYWIVVCHPVKGLSTCDIQGLKEVRDQLWAEAKWEYDFDGENPQIDLPEEYWPAAVAMQSANTKANELEAALSHHLGVMEGEVSAEALWTVLGVAITGRQREATAFGAAMKNLGWVKAQKRVGDKRPWVYQKGDAPYRPIDIVTNAHGHTLGYVEQAALEGPSSDW